MLQDAEGSHIVMMVDIVHGGSGDIEQSQFTGR